MNEWELPLAQCTVHEMKYPYNKKKVTPPIPAYSEVERSQDTFMTDARRSGARGGSGARGQAAPPPSVAQEIKQLNWFQKNVLYMNVEIRRGQYDAHLEREQLAHNQALIMHRLKTPQLPPPKQKDHVPYKK